MRPDHQRSRGTTPVCNLDLAGKRFGKSNQSNLLSMLHYAARPGQAYETTKKAHTHDILKPTSGCELGTLVVV